MNLVFKIENGKVMDINECRNFKTISNGIKKQRRVQLDKDDISF